MRVWRRGSAKVRSATLAITGERSPTMVSPLSATSLQSPSCRRGWALGAGHMRAAVCSHGTPSREGDRDARCFRTRATAPWRRALARSPRATARAGSRQVPHRPAAETWGQSRLRSMSRPLRCRPRPMAPKRTVRSTTTIRSQRNQGIDVDCSTQAHTPPRRHAQMWLAPTSHGCGIRAVGNGTSRAE